MTVSIIIPAWNVEQYIRRAIEGCQAQTYRDLEIIVVDDGSTDDTIAIAQSYAVNDARVKVYAKEHSGVSATRNYGIQKATGDYFMFADSDDWIEPDTVETLIKLAQDYPDYVPAVNFARNKEYSSERSSRTDGNVRTIDSKELHMVVGTGEYGSSTACFRLFETPIVKGNSLKYDEDIYFGEDELFVFKYYYHRKGVVLDGDVYGHVLERATSATRTAFNERYLTSLTAAERLIEYAKAHENSENKQKQLDYLCSLIVVKALNLYRRLMKAEVNAASARQIRSYIRKYAKWYRKQAGCADRIRMDLALMLPYPVYRMMYNVKEK